MTFSNGTRLPGSLTSASDNATLAGKQSAKSERDILSDAVRHEHEKESLSPTAIALFRGGPLRVCGHGGLLSLCLVTYRRGA